MSALVGIDAEWQRIDLLGSCVAAQRRGEAIDAKLKEALSATQARVSAARTSAIWQTPASRGLDTLDRDILTCVTAPDAEPRLGWLYQDLQPGITSAYPTPSLIRELLFIDEASAPAFHARFAKGSNLRRLELIEAGHEPYQPLKPTARARALLLGWDTPVASSFPGAIELPATAGWNDLVLPTRCRRTLEELLASITHRERIERDWGARPSAGPIALFSGPSGTGKTFAAEVLASALGYRLLRVDLGLLVSKYIGETEKNLNSLLDAVAKEPVVLLFDEADSLFGRRGDVRDARDRYANMEVSHLLSRIELHRGPCILTTNLRQHLDAAFLRRFHTVIEFPRPTAEARAVLWRLHLPPKAPLQTGLDFEKLGTAVPLSGGQIKNAALYAALLAAHEDASVAWSHLARAVWNELAKDGRELNPGMLGALAADLPGGYS